ncbi:hypothetical protein VTJ04DRAFT_82 [Mycothermus thermophilus]|uniref:uncharacterized protein n=1 Tax=Humicola insolens TaxID=85995 RepID=UPI0037433D96
MTSHKNKNSEKMPSNPSHPPIHPSSCVQEDNTQKPTTPKPSMDRSIHHPSIQAQRHLAKPSQPNPTGLQPTGP